MNRFMPLACCKNATGMTLRRFVRLSMNRMYCPCVSRRLESTNLGVKDSMPNQFSLKNFGLLLLALGFLSIPGPAQAGFQWVAPPTPSEVPTSSPTAPMAESVGVPMATQQPEILSPGLESSSQVPSSSSEPIEPVIVGGGPAPMPLAGHEGMRSLSPASSDVVQGFAKQVPLAVALRQILPPGYGFSIDPSVDMGVLVSFQGGKSWHDTLKEALEPAGLIMRERGQMVSIGYPVPDHNVAAPVKPASSAQGHFLTLPPSMLRQSSSLPPPVVISGAGPSVMPAPVPAAVSSVPEGWDAERGDNLRKVFDKWSRIAGVELDWMSEYDYPLQASVHFSGTFEDAVRNLLTGFETAHPQPVAELHSNSKIGQTVLVVTTRGNAGE